MEKEMEYLEAARRVPMPGAALNTMLNRWAEEPVDTPVQFSEYILGLWKSREQFEKELREEERGIYLFVQLIKDEFLQRTRFIRQTASFRMQALETAMIETKIKCQQEMDRCNMRVAEIESSFLNQQKSDGAITREMEEALQIMNRDLDMNNPAVVKQIKNAIDLLNKSIMSLTTERNTQNNRIKDLEYTLEKMEEQMAD